MNRAKNRQPRPPRPNANRGAPRSNRGPPATPQQAAGTVPTTNQVVTGATVFIVLKEDQPKGRETRGVVQDVLTRGNHPRGIKVRLRDGQVGRVQRMADDSTAAAASAASASSASSASSGQPGGQRFTMRYSDVRNDEFLDGPPPRSLADFMPDVPEPEAPSVPGLKCPFCDEFEGDETAVTHHIEQAHLS